MLAVDSKLFKKMCIDENTCTPWARFGCQTLIYCAQRCLQFSPVLRFSCSLSFKSHDARQVELRKKKKLRGKKKKKTCMASFHGTLPSQNFSYFGQFQNCPGSRLFLPRPGLPSLIQPGPLCAQGAFQVILTHTKDWEPLSWVSSS